MQALKSVKINSPHMMLIQDMKENLLYDRAIKDNVPFFQWHKWLETTLNQEVLKCMFQQSKKTGALQTVQKDNLNKYIQETKRKSKIEPGSASVKNKPVKSPFAWN